MTPLARQKAEAGSTGWGGLSSSDSSLSDSREVPGEAGGGDWSRGRGFGGLGGLQTRGSWVQSKPLVWEGGFPRGWPRLKGCLLGLAPGRGLGHRSESQDETISPSCPPRPWPGPLTPCLPGPSSWVSLAGVRPRVGGQGWGDLHGHLGPLGPGAGSPSGPQRPRGSGPAWPSRGRQGYRPSLSCQARPLPES